MRKIKNEIDPEWAREWEKSNCPLCVRGVKVEGNVTCSIQRDMLAMPEMINIKSAEAAMEDICPFIKYKKRAFRI